MSADQWREGQLKRLGALLRTLGQTADINPGSTYAHYIAEQFTKANTAYRQRSDVCSFCGLHDTHNPGCPNEDE